VISSVANIKKSVVVLIYKNYWYAFACDGEKGEIWPTKEINEEYISHLSSLFLNGELLEKEEEIQPILQFIWENEFGPAYEYRS